MTATQPSPLLHHTTLGGIADVWVTQNPLVATDTYSNNLALHVKDDAAAVVQRRSQLEKTIQRPIQWLHQVHGTVVYDVHTDASPTAEAPTADASITRSKHIALAVMTADCLPVVLSAQNTQGDRAVAVAHAGWRGLHAGVLAKSVAALNQQVGAATIHAHMAPCIGVGAFEVGAEVKTAFIDAIGAAATPFFTASRQKSGADRYLCDLSGLARYSLLSLGVAAISGGGWCTVSDPRLASYRRQAVTGRFATVVALRD